MLGSAPLGAVSLGAVLRGGAAPNYISRRGFAPLASPRFIDRRDVSSAQLVSAVADNPSADIAFKMPVRLATTPVDGDQPLFGLTPIDGTTPADGDRVLVTHQDDPTQNGPYLASSSRWQRVGDARGNDQITPGMLLTVQQGTINAGAVFTLSGPTTTQIVLGTTPLLFSSVSINPPVSLQATLDSGGVGFGLGLKLQLEVPSAMTLSRWTLLADVAGTMTVDVWRAPFASLPLSAGNSITGGDPPALTGGISAQGNDLSGWQRELSAGDILGFDIIAAALVTRVTLSLYGARP